MARKRSAIEEERMTDANIQKVINLLEPKTEGDTPITKKEACQILGMSYNTTRLASIIEKFKEAKKRTAERRAEKRNKPISMDEVVYIIQEYIEGSTIDSISNSIYRSTALVKKVLEEYSVPIRARAHNWFKPELIPDECMRERFNPGEIVYSARYDSTARVLSERASEFNGYVYSIWVLGERWQQCAFQEAYELASLEHLRKIGVRV